MKRNNLQNTIRIYALYCAIGFLAGIIWYALIAALLGDGDVKDVTLACAATAGAVLGFLFAKIRLITKNIAICAATDPLTQMNNRIRFNEILDREILRSNRHGTNLSVVLVDIDSFNKINKTYGRKVADDVLTRISTIVKAVSRDVDICARWGGDEFILLLPDTALKGAAITAERLRASVADEFIPVVGQVTISLGVAQFRLQKDLKETFIDRADNALYRVKQKGRNGVEIDENPMN